MEVNAKQTEVKNVKVELSHQTQQAVVKAQSLDLLIDVVSKRLEHWMVESFTSDLKKGAYVIRGTYYRGERQWCLMEIDADWDYHNNVGRDEVVRPLTDEEKAKYFHLDHAISEVQTLISELENK